VPFGATITAEDLREVTIPAGSTLRTVGWADRQILIGPTWPTSCTRRCGCR
jgi:hypothetical protein